jgi:hypothetical protein
LIFLCAFKQVAAERSEETCIYGTLALGGGAYINGLDLSSFMQEVICYEIFIQLLS